MKIGGGGVRAKPLFCEPPPPQCMWEDSRNDNRSTAGHCSVKEDDVTRGLCARIALESMSLPGRGEKGRGRGTKCGNKKTVLPGEVKKAGLPLVNNDLNL